MIAKRKLTLLTLLAFLAPVGFAGTATASLLMPIVDDDEDEEAEDEEEEEKEHILAVVGGDVHTGNGMVLRGATVLARDGVIEEISAEVWVPEDAEVIDATGMRVYPGLIAIQGAPNLTQSGGMSTDTEFDPHEGHKHVGEIHFDTIDVLRNVADGLEPRITGAAIEDSFDPFSSSMVLALATGITTTVSSGAAVKLKRGEIDDIVVGEGFLRTFSWSNRNPAGKRTLREKFKRASEYLREYRAWEARPKAEKEEKPPSDKDVDKGVLSVLTGQARAQFSTNERDDLLSLARFAQEFDFRPVINGCVEGWTVASELGRAGASAIITPRDRRNKDEELVRAGGSTIENAAILYEHGVQVAIIPRNTSVNLQGIMGRDIQALLIEAGFAIRGGLPESAALEALTVVPARMLGISHRVGTLEPGKDADLIVTDGDVLHYETFVQYTVVDGKLVYDKAEETFYSHIRPRPEAEESEEEQEEEEGDHVDEDEDAEEHSEDDADEDADEDEESEEDDDEEEDDGDDD